MVACLLFDFKKWRKRSRMIQFPPLGAEIIKILILPEHPECLCLHLNVNEKVPIWQVVLDLEIENIVTGYGFGQTFSEAKTEALQFLVKRTSHHNDPVITNR